MGNLMNSQRMKTQRGLVILGFALVMLLIMALGLLQLQRRHLAIIAISTNNYHSEQALMIADAGLQYGVAQLIANPVDLGQTQVDNCIYNGQQDAYVQQIGSSSSEHYYHREYTDRDIRYLDGYGHLYYKNGDYFYDSGAGLDASKQYFSDEPAGASPLPAMSTINISTLQTSLPDVAGKLLAVSFAHLCDTEYRVIATGESGEVTRTVEMTVRVMPSDPANSSIKLDSWRDYYAK